jgi:hypothetical protein
LNIDRAALETNPPRYQITPSGEATKEWSRNINSLVDGHLIAKISERLRARQADAWEWLKRQQGLG